MWKLLVMYPGDGLRISPFVGVFDFMAREAAESAAKFLGPDFNTAVMADVPPTAPDVA